MEGERRDTGGQSQEKQMFGCSRTGRKLRTMEMRGRDDVMKEKRKRGSIV